MKYFLIEMDKAIAYAPNIINWYKNIDINSINKGEFYKVPYRTLLEIENNPNTVFVDIISSPFFLVTKEVSKILSKFEPNLGYKQIILLDKSNQIVKQYFMPILEEYDCLSDQSELNIDKSVIKNAVIDLSKVKDKCLFKIGGVKNKYVVARLDFIESILRRNAFGFNLKEIDTIGQVEI